MAELLLDDFSGGVNLRDSPNQIQLNESPRGYNYTLDERGGLNFRNGHANVVALPGVSGKKADIFYSAALDQWLCAREVSGAPNTFKLFTRPGDLSGTWTDRGTINSNVAARAGFVDFPGNPPKVVLCTNKNDGATKGIFTWDGTNLVDVAAGDAVCGDGLALWQDRVYVIGYPVSDANGNPTLARWCDPKDPTAWTSTNVQQFREKDAAPLTGIAVCAGGLIVFKKRSTMRVNDAATGAYSTIDSSVGCVNPRAIAALYGRLYVWAADGIYESDGVGRLENIGDKLRPVFYNDSTLPTTICAGVSDDRLIFTGTIVDPTTSQWDVLEGHPRRRWWIAHPLASASQDEISSLAMKDGVLYAAVTDGDDLFRMFTETPGKDDTTAYDAAWYTPWLLPNSGMLARLQRARIQGRRVTGGTLAVSLQLAKNWDGSSLESFDIAAGLTTGAEQAVFDIQSLGHAYAFQFNIACGGPDTGTVSIRAIQLIDTPLQWPNPGYPRGRERNTPPPPPPKDGGGGPPPAD